MRIAIVTPNLIRGDGQGRTAFEYARYALQRGAEVHLVAHRVDPELVALGGQWSQVAIPAPLRKVMLLRVIAFAEGANRAVARLRASTGNDLLVHNHGYCLTLDHDVNTAQFVHGAWRRSPYHTARLTRGLYSRYQWFYSWFNSRMERIAFDRARVVVAVSKTVHQELCSIGIPERKIRVIYNGASPDEFHPGPADRAALKLPEGVPLALFAGDIRTPRKNLDTVLKALATVPSLHLAVVGRTEGSPFPARAAELGIADRVHFLGFRLDIGDIMRACDLFVFPSRYEPFGMVVLEAMMSGLPTLTTRNVGAAEIITPGAGIVLPDPEEVSALAEAMARIVRDPDERKRMGAQAREAALRCAWDSIAAQYYRLYEELSGVK